MTRTNLLDLPVLPLDRDGAAGTSRVSSTFVSDRKKVSSASMLREFVNKWRPVWLLSAGPMPESSGNLFIDECRAELSEESVKVVNGEFDHELLSTLVNDSELTLDDPRLKDNSELISLVGEIVLPPAMLFAFHLSNRYGVGNDLGLVRIYLDTYPDLIDEGRPFRKTEANEQD